MSSEEIVKSAVLDFPEDVLQNFLAEFANEIEDFINVMTVAYDAWKSFDSKISGDEELAHISSLVYGAINLHAISMHLLISGFLIAAGNTQRQVLESIAMAFLGSKRNLGYLHRYANNKFSTNKAVDLVIKKHKILNLNHDALIILRRSRNFYNKLSHPTIMTVASHISLENRGVTFFGASFDGAKRDIYRKEISSRINLAKTFVNFIIGIEQNLRL